MKNIVLLITALTTLLFSQTPDWTSPHATNIDASSASSFDIFSNGYAHHVIVQESNSLKYYKMDANGNADNAITIESSSVVSPSICGDNNRLYVVYRKSSESYIRTKFSSDGGSSWSYISTINYNANTMESVFSNNKLHVTFDVSNVAYYSYYNTENPGWSALQTVSTGENGSLPRITTWYTSSQDRVMFLYKKTSTESRWREWNTTNSIWATNPQTAFTVSSSYSSDPKGIAVDANYIYSYYEYTVYNPYTVYSQRQQRLRSNNSLVSTSVAQAELLAPKMFSTTTTDNVSHTAFYYNGVLEGGYEIGIMRNKHTGSGISYDPAYPYEFGFNQLTLINISSASNDVFVVWKDGLSNYLNFVYDDQVPLAPQNLTVTKSAANHPLLSWTKNNEADLQNYKVYKYVISEFGWQYYGTVTTNSFEDVNESYPVKGGSGLTHPVQYKVTAVDFHPYESLPSNTVLTYVSGALLEKSNSGKLKPSEFSLDQNYPNPFNPYTKISYSIKEEGLVTLKVYDILGKEIATLVNEIQPEGIYDAEFNASQLPSGMYIYKIQSGSFSDVKKMILTK